MKWKANGDELKERGIVEKKWEKWKEERNIIYYFFFFIKS